MTALTWANSPRYEHGVDRGVLYRDSVGFGWTGLTAVDADFDANEIEPYYFDGVLYRNFVVHKTFEAQISAFSAPREFGPCIGMVEARPGVIFTEQDHQPFDFSYRTQIGDDLGYKVHLVYNATAETPEENHETLSDSVSVESKSWRIHTVPPKALLRRPTAHFTIDSTKTSSAVMAEIEKVLYGGSKRDSRLPQLGYFLNLMTSWAPKGLTRNSVTGLSTITVNGSDISLSKTAGVFIPLAEGKLAPSSTPGVFTF